MDLGIRGKTALVCAASKGLGKGCAMSLAREGANAVIVVRDRGPGIAPSERERVFENTQNVAGWMADLDGHLRLGFRVNEEGGNEVLRVDGSALEKVYECTYEETCQPIRFHKDGTRLTENLDFAAEVFGVAGRRARARTLECRQHPLHAPGDAQLHR